MAFVFKQLQEARSSFADPRIFDLIFIALVVFTVSFLLISVSFTMPDAARMVACCLGMTVIAADVLFLCGVYLFLLFAGKPVSSAENYVEKGILQAKAGDEKARQEAGSRAASVPGGRKPAPRPASRAAGEGDKR